MWSNYRRNDQIAISISKTKLTIAVKRVAGAIFCLPLYNIKVIFCWDLQQQSILTRVSKPPPSVCLHIQTAGSKAQAHTNQINGWCENNNLHRWACTVANDAHTHTHMQRHTYPPCTLTVWSAATWLHTVSLFSGNPWEMEKHISHFNLMKGSVSLAADPNQHNVGIWRTFGETVRFLQNLLKFEMRRNCAKGWGLHKFRLQHQS